MLKEKLLGASGVLDGFLLGVLSDLGVKLNKGLFVVEELMDSIDSVVDLLELTSKGSQELASSLVPSMDVSEDLLGYGLDNLTLVDEDPADLIPHLGLSLILCALLTSSLALGSALLLANTSHSGVISDVTLAITSSLHCLGVSL